MGTIVEPTKNDHAFFVMESNEVAWPSRKTVSLTKQPLDHHVAVAPRDDGVIIILYWLCYI